MEHFWDTIETIVEGYGFSLFGARHLVTLALFVLTAVLCCRGYAHADAERRAKMRRVFAILLLLDEVFKQIGLQIGGNFDASYLPLHLCSINIFLIAVHAWRRSEVLDNFLYYNLYPSGNGGAAVSDVDVAPGDELHVPAFDERAYSARGVSDDALCRGRYPAEREGTGKEPAPAARDGDTNLRGEPAAGYELYVPDVRAGRQSACVVPGPVRQPLGGISCAACGGRRAHVSAGAAEKKT